MTAKIQAASMEALKTFLNIPATENDKNDLLDMLLCATTEAAEKYLGRFIIARDIAGEPHDFDGSKTKYLQLEHYPALQITEIRQNGAALPLEMLVVDKHNGLIKKAGGWRGLVTADYKAGLAPDTQSVPKNISVAVCRWVSEILQTQQACGVKSETLGDYSITYYEESALPRAVTLMLDPYRRADL